jgi:hypothetical protein
LSTSTNRVATKYFINIFHETMDALGIPYTEDVPAPITVVDEFTTGIEGIVAKGGYKLLESHLSAVSRSLSSVYTNSPDDVSKKTTVARYMAVMLMSAILQQSANPSIVLNQHWAPIVYTRGWSRHDGAWKRNLLNIHQTAVIKPASAPVRNGMALVQTKSMNKRSLMHQSKDPDSTVFSPLMETFFGTVESRFNTKGTPEIVSVTMMVMHSVRSRLMTGGFASGSTQAVLTSMLAHLDSFDSIFVRTMRIRSLRLPMNLCTLPVYRSIRYGKVVVFPLNTTEVIVVSSEAPVHGPELVGYVAWFIGRVVRTSISTGYPVAGLSKTETQSAIDFAITHRGENL